MAAKRGKIVSEFKTFILRGNVIDLAVGIIIGGAFNKIVTSMVNDVMMPFISFFIGTGHLKDMFIPLDGQSYPNLEAATEASAPLLMYGSFFATVLDFLLMGLVVFAMVKFLNLFHTKLSKDKPAEEVEPVSAVKECPFCMSQINADAKVCPMCTSKLDEI